MSAPKGNLVTPVGFRSDGTIHGLELDTSDRLRVVSEVSGTPPSPRLTHYENLSLAAGTNNLAVVTPPAGEVWKISFFNTYYIGTMTNVVLQLALVQAAVEFRAVTFLNPLVSGTPYQSAIDMIIDSTVTVRLNVYAATLNDDVYFNLFGYRVYQ